MGTSLEGIERTKAEKRLKATQFKPGQSGKHYPSTKIFVSPEAKNRPSSREVSLPTKENVSPKKPLTTSYEIAKRIGVSHATYERSKKIIQKN